METSGLSFAEARELASAEPDLHHPHAGRSRPRLFSARTDGPLFRRLCAQSRTVARRVPGAGPPRRLGSGRVLHDRAGLATGLASQTASASCTAQVSRQMWQSLWPGVPVDEVPIGHVTNGVHFRSLDFAGNEAALRPLSGPRLARRAGRRRCLEPRANRFRPRSCGARIERRRERLVAWARSRVRDQRIRRSAPPAEIEAADEVLDPDALTIGFARRFATYKRATLILRDLRRLRAHADRYRPPGANHLRRQGASRATTPARN